MKATREGKETVMAIQQEGAAEVVTCELPGDCPNGPHPHPFAAPDLALMCCCKQPWED